jgi:hypothetical protein
LNQPIQAKFLGVAVARLHSSAHNSVGFATSIDYKDDDIITAASITRITTSLVQRAMHDSIVLRDDLLLQSLPFNEMLFKKFNIKAVIHNTNTHPSIHESLVIQELTGAAPSKELIVRSVRGAGLP